MKWYVTIAFTVLRILHSQMYNYPRIIWFKLSINSGHKRKDLQNPCSFEWLGESSVNPSIEQRELFLINLFTTLFINSLILKVSSEVVQCCDQECLFHWLMRSLCPADIFWYTKNSWWIWWGINKFSLFLMTEFLFWVDCPFKWNTVLSWVLKNVKDIDWIKAFTCWSKRAQNMGNGM